MHQHLAIGQVHQQELGAPRHPRNGGILQPGHLVRHRPAQLALAQQHAANAPALQVRRDAPARGFDFWQFGHGVVFTPVATGMVGLRRYSVPRNV